ncbi:hypothetical protein U14_02559 [Candidatus Moduliflexus flocculans]|uniref:Spermidine synthase n=1 Tax=Candidatus Moduliflexus flocculans TaxID=1499966 RepID=A0A081BLQ0_9BACT|nr:hypothetical protein U14_02559 [Candidatus Moduliflexus flocculans]
MMHYRLRLLLITTAVFLSAAMLFWIEPMFSKAALPILGGVPAVWTTCLVFYQFTLLAGYLYAHLLSTRVPFRVRVWFHLALVCGAAVTMRAFAAAPLVLPKQPVLWLFWQFIATIGLPFFALSATAPLLQTWIGASSWWIYAISNAGSLFGLVSYPFLVEPLLPLAAQQCWWRQGFRVFAALLVGIAVVCRRAEPPRRSVSESCNAAPISWKLRLFWLVAAAIPSSLLFGVTSHITTDIATIPLFWALPLGLYLLSFILVFAKRTIISHSTALTAQSLFVFPLLLGAFARLRTNFWFDLPLHLTAFFAFCMLCHGELARHRPSASHFTEFYLYLAAGGCLGGVFTALLAPLLFNSTFEYPLMIACTCLLRSAPDTPPSNAQRRWFAFGSLGAACLLPIAFAMPNQRLTVGVGTASFLLLTACFGAIGLSYLRTFRQIAFGLGAVLLVAAILFHHQYRYEFRQRNFFGTLRVTPSPDGRFTLFYHGTTLHGAQRRTPDGSAEPLTYFHKDSPLGQMFAALKDQPPRQVAVFGLGVGTVAAYNRIGDRMTFYEIDPDVEAVARHAEWFRYLKEAAGDVSVVVGDARIALKNAPDHRYDLFIQDAFSSDMIPLHLLTAEAFERYLEKLQPDGLLAFNITNRHINLEPLFAELFYAYHITGLVWRDSQTNRELDAEYRYPSAWVIASRSQGALAPFSADVRWRPLQRRPGMRLWTDDYSNLFSVIKWPGQ